MAIGSKSSSREMVKISRRINLLRKLILTIGRRMILLEIFPFAMNAEGDVILPMIVAIKRIRSSSQRKNPCMTATWDDDSDVSEQEAQSNEDHTSQEIKAFMLMALPQVHVVIKMI